MTPSELSALVHLYRCEMVGLAAAELGAARFPGEQWATEEWTDESATADELQLRHVLWMLDQIEGMAARVRALLPEVFRGDQAAADEATMVDQKAQRWIGFVQGVLWARGIFSIDELAAHVTAAGDRDIVEEHLTGEEPDFVARVRGVVERAHNRLAARKRTRKDKP